jgi:ketosteroid isomerase-like protein
VSAANGARTDTADAALATKATFVEQFRVGWAGGADTLVDLFLPDLLDPDVVMTQPLLPPARGHDGFAAFFETLFGAIPDLRGTVRDWRATDDGVEIDFTLHGTLGGAPFELPTTDRIVLRDGRVLERHARMEPRALLATVARHPLAATSLLAAPLRAQPPLERALAGLALGRVVLGTSSRLAPRGTARTFGAGRAASSELDYMTRVFGIRAVALGLGWLSSDGAARRRWQRLAFLCDVSDTLAGIGHLRRGDLRRAPALATTALTGGYALVGALRVAGDVRARARV